MISIKTGQLPDQVGEVVASFRKTGVRIIRRMAGYQKAVERNSMLRMPRVERSPAGTPPFTHPRTSKKGNTLSAFPQFIHSNVTENGFQSKAVVGPTKPSHGRRSTWAERIGHTHEFGGTYTVEKRVYRDRKTGQFLTAADRVPLYSGGKKTFPFTILQHKKARITKKGEPYKNDREWMLISYQAKYPKRPFAAPALRKTVAATQQGKFGQ